MPQILVKDVVRIIERHAPKDLIAQWDRCGLSVGEEDTPVTGVLLCEDVTPAIVDEAKSLGYRLIVSHHPVLFRGIDCVKAGEYVSDIVTKALIGGICLYSAHSNMDACEDGINARLCRELGFEIQSGEGAFYRIGRANKTPHRAADLMKKLAELTGKEGLRFAGDLSKPCARICVASGSGGRDEELVESLKEAQVDLFVTSEVKHSVAKRLEYYGIALAECTHYASETICKQIWAEWLKDTGVTVRISAVERSPYQS